MEENHIIKNRKTEDEIDFIEIATKLWINRKFILAFTIMFIGVGLFVALLTPNQFTAKTILVPQSSDKKSSSNLSGLAAIAGINIGSITSGEIISPAIYPKIFNNVDFQKELIYTKFSFNISTKTITYYDYYSKKEYQKFNLLNILKKYTIGLPSLIISSLKHTSNNISNLTDFNKSNIQILSKKENEIIKNLFGKLELELNEKEGYITLKFTSYEPILSAEVVSATLKLLQKYITEFKLQKVRSNLSFVEANYFEAKHNFELKQSELARFRDANKSLTSSIAKTQEEKLISEYNLMLGIYSELAKQREQAKIAVTETAPILTIIQPVVIPIEKSGPKRINILIFYTFLGISISSIYILSRRLLINFIENFKKNS